MVLTIGRGKIAKSEVDASSGNPKTFFAACNRGYERRIAQIVSRICKDVSRSKIIMLSGPSASGKTTTSLKMKQQLERRGVHAVTLSMDDFFKNRDGVPELPDGTRDFESLNAVDLPLFSDTMQELLSQGTAQIPIFDFKTGTRRKETRTATLDEGTVAVVEGLHALDTAVTSAIPAEQMLRIYISVSSDFIGADENVLLSARDIRLLRRTVRDWHFRGYGPEETLDMWDSVCKGEDRYVRPFKKYADVTFNSVFRCEPCLFAKTSERLFGRIAQGSPHYGRARKILDAVAQFSPMPLKLMPGNCVLREFFGGSIYYDKNGNNKEK